MKRPIGIDLFAGAGGMTLGFEQAGFDVKAAIEIDPIHCATHKFNFPDCAVIPHSVRDLTGAQIREIAGLGKSPIDVVFGGPPCQGFSLIGHRSLDDPRNHLVLEFVRLVKELKPKTFVFENVKGLSVGKQRAFLEEIVQAFTDIGYVIRKQWRVLNASNYGVPQNRERLILIGSKSGLTIPEYPALKTIPADADNKVKSTEIKKGPSCSDALNDLPNVDLFEELLTSDTVEAKLGKPSNYAKELRCLTNDAWHYAYVRKWNPQILTSSARTEHSDISMRRFSETPQGQVEPISRFYKLKSYGLANTLRAGTDSARGAFTSPRPIHYKYHRCVTVREMARLHGFPDWFRFHTTKWHGARQIGNSVPPPLSKAIALEIIKSLGAVPSRPTEVIELGNEKLLSLTATEAAKFFGIEQPIAKRDRKSGAKKRRQTEIEALRIAEMDLIND